MGMKREAVQEERQRTKDRDTEVESTSNMQTDMPIERILEAEKMVDCKEEQPVEYEVEIFIFSIEFVWHFPKSLALHCKKMNAFCLVLN